MVFKARKLPSFGEPFTPTREGKATAPFGFAFATDTRLGRPKTSGERCDAAAPAVQPDAFAAHLRRSELASAVKSALVACRSGAMPSKSVATKAETVAMSPRIAV
eukprot:361501-Chlamydomonas_euryale.AAC.3